MAAPTVAPLVIPVVYLSLVVRSYGNSNLIVKKLDSSDCFKEKSEMAYGNNPLEDQSKLWAMNFQPRMSKQEQAKSECFLKETVREPDLIRVRQLIKNRIDLLYRKIQNKEQSVSLRSSLTHTAQDFGVLGAPKQVNSESALPSTVVKWNTLPNDDLTRNQLLTLVSERLRLNRSLYSTGQQNANSGSASIEKDIGAVKTSRRTPRQSIMVRHHVHQDSDTGSGKLVIPKRNTSHLTVQRLPSIDVRQEESADNYSSPSKKLVNHALVQADLPRSFRITQADDVVEVMAEVLQEEMQKVLGYTSSLDEPLDEEIHTLRKQSTGKSDGKASAETEDITTRDEAEEEEEAGIDFLSLMRRLQAGASTQTESTNQRDHGTSPISLQVENRHSQTQSELENRSSQYSPVGTSHLSEVMCSPTAHVLNNDREDGLSPPRQVFPTPSPLPSLPSSGFHDLPSPLSESPPTFANFAELSVQVDNELLNETFIVEEATIASSRSANDASSVLEQNTVYTYSEGEVKRTLSLGEFSENRPYVLSEGEVFLPAHFIGSAHYSTISEGEVSEGLADIPNLPQD